MPTTTKTTLHIINKTTTNARLYQDCCDSMLEGDELLLIESAVYAGCEQNFHSAIPTSFPIYALEVDVAARGLTDKLNKEIQLIDDNQFVNLCCIHHKSISWF
ncbi:MAG: sulfurtransferase complex subunit TusB [Oceanospirillaceae bacterium]